jgi:hypothetical protein
MPEKFFKNIKFSRTKKFANSEGDIAKNEAALNNWKNERKMEREQNLVLASGKVLKGEQPENRGEEEEEEVMPLVRENLYTYYTKMNLIIQNLPTNYSVSKLCKTFEQLGSIQCVCTFPKESVQIPHDYYDAKIVPNEWSELVSAVQQEIFELGYSEYEVGNGVVCKIVRDPKQKLSDYGEEIEYH